MPSTRNDVSKKLFACTDEKLKGSSGLVSRKSPVKASTTAARKGVLKSPAKGGTSSAVTSGKGGEGRRIGSLKSPVKGRSSAADKLMHGSSKSPLKDCSSAERRSVNESLKSPAKGDSSAKVKTPKGGNDAPTNLRPPKRNAAIIRENIVDLGRLNSAEFMETIGKGSSVRATAENKKLIAKRKQEEALRISTLTNLNGNVLCADGINISFNDEDDLAEEAQSPAHNMSSHSSVLGDTVLLNPDNYSNFHSAPNNSNESNVIIDTTLKSTTSKETNTAENEDSNKKDFSEINTTADAKHCHKFTQTPKIHYLCNCEKCQSCTAQFIQIIQTGSSQFCTSKTMQSLEEQPSIVLNRSDIEEEFVPLYRGARLKVSVTTKAKLKSVNSDSIKDYVNIIMESLFTDVQMAHMTAKGRTKESLSMSSDIRDAILVYLRNKFDDVEEKDLTEAVNQKCYAERRKLWSKGEATIVRKPLPKKGSATSKSNKHEKPKKSKSEDQYKSKSKKPKNKLAELQKTSFNQASASKSYHNSEEKSKTNSVSMPTQGGKCPKSDMELMKITRKQNIGLDSFQNLKYTSTPFCKGKSNGLPSKKDSTGKKKHRKVSNDDNFSDHNKGSRKHYSNEGEDADSGKRLKKRARHNSSDEDSDRSTQRKHQRIDDQSTDEDDDSDSQKENSGSGSDDSG